MDVAWLAAAELLNVVAVLGVLSSRRRDPTATLAWILALFALPVVGLILYIIFGTTRFRRLVRRSERASARLKQILGPFGVRARFDTATDVELPARTYAMTALGGRLSSTPATIRNDATLLQNAGATYRALLTACEEATHHIHVQFYIIQPDATGQVLRDRLTQRAKEGIEVRVLYDSVGSMALPWDFFAPLVAAGGEVASFSPVWHVWGRLRRRDRIDFRNHRKIVVVDGKVGFTGGINIGKEYLGLDPNVGAWRDTHVRLEGPAALCLQEIFAQDWFLATERALDDAHYFPEHKGHPKGQCVVQVVDSGPDGEWASMELLYAQAINLSRHRLWVTSPYFVPSRHIQTAFETAALRGVDVRLLLPSRSDHLLVGLASRSYYPDLIEAGVRIYEYERGFVHAKTMVVDDWMGTVGSANMDMRSFHLNFEVNAFVFSHDFAQDLGTAFQRDLSTATEIDAERVSSIGSLPRLARSAARLLSPVL